MEVLNYLLRASLPSAVMHRKCNVSWRLGGENITKCGVILCGWALRRYSAVGHCRDTWWLGTARILCGWALQGYLVAKHRSDTWWLGTARILCGWALQGFSAVGHRRNTLPWSTASKLLAEGEDNIDLKI